MGSVGSDDAAELSALCAGTQRPGPGLRAPHGARAGSSARHLQLQPSHIRIYLFL